MPPATGGNSKKTVSIYDRGSQFELLRQLPGSYMWISSPAFTAVSPPQV